MKTWISLTIFCYFRAEDGRPEEPAVRLHTSQEKRSHLSRWQSPQSLVHDAGFRRIAHFDTKKGWTLDRAGIRNLLLKLTCIILMVDIIKLQRLLFSEFSSPGPAAICLPSLIGGAFHTFSLSTSPSLHFSSGSYPIRLHLLVLSLHLEQFSSKTWDVRWCCSNYVAKPHIICNLKMIRTEIWDVKIGQVGKKHIWSKGPTWCRSRCAQYNVCPNGQTIWCPFCGASQDKRTLTPVLQKKQCVQYSCEDEAIVIWHVGMHHLHQHLHIIAGWLAE